MKHYLIIGTLALAAVMGGCNSKSADKEARSTETKAAAEMFGPASTQKFHDAAFFDLYGNVKSCEIEDTGNHSVTTLQFDADGKLIPDKAMAGRYAFEYDAEGYPTAYPAGTLTWERGRLSKSTGEAETSCTYDDKGVMTETITPAVNYAYRVTETDPVGNWIKRHVKTMKLDKDGNVTEVTESFQRRTIEYYTD